MYLIKPTNEVFIPTKLPVRVGLPIQQDMIPDICIVSTNNSEPLVMNSIVLREALINSKDLLTLLGLRVSVLDAIEVEQNVEQNEVVTEPIKKVKASKGSEE